MLISIMGVKKFTGSDATFFSIILSHLTSLDSLTDT